MLLFLLLDSDQLETDEDALKPVVVVVVVVNDDDDDVFIVIAAVDVVVE